MTAARNGSGPEANGVFDLSAAAAAEAARDPFRFRYKGKDYELPPQQDWPMAALQALSNGDLDAAMSPILGKSYDALVAAGLTVGALNTRMDKVATQSGMEPQDFTPSKRPASRTRT
jgi:hypothetical protein